MKILCQTVIFLACAFLLESPGTADAGVYDAWGYRMKIRLAGYDKAEPLTNFTALVSLRTNDISGFRYSDFNSPTDGADLRFAASNETTELNYEIDQWDTNGTSHVWVQIPLISSSNDFIYAYWGNATAAAPCTTNGDTWSNDFKGVWHLTETSGPQADSTANRNGATMSGTVLQGVSGQIGGADDCTSGYPATTNNLGITGSSPRTISLWFKQDSDLRKAIAGFGIQGNLRMFDVLLLGGVMTHFYAGNTPGMAYTIGPWQHAAVTYDGTTILIYINGELKYQGNWSLDTGDAPLFIGAGKYDGSVNGKVDEVQVSTVVRSSNWIWTAWFNQASNGSFLAFSGVGPMATSLVVVANAATGFGPTTATLNGMVVHAGNAENPYTYFCWDTTNAGTSATSDWAHVISMGTNWGKGQTFSTNLTGLLSGTSYTYRCYATNSTGLDWSDAAVSFRTLYPPVVTNLGASSVGGVTATLHGEVTDTGAEAPSVWFYYWPVGGSTTVVARGIQTGVFQELISGLQNGLTYTYRCCASNAAGIAWSGDQSFATSAKDRTWTGAVNSDWFTEGNWSPAGIPQSGDTVTVPSATPSPVVTNSTAALAALTVSSGTLTCSNWTTVIRATDITLQNTGIITLPPAFTESAMSNRVYLVCTNLTVETGGSIDVSERGYGINSGPGKGFGNDLVGGSGHGGQGGYAQGAANIPNVAGGSTYGSETEPSAPGSSSPLCYAGDRSGKGGGVIRIEATDTVTVNGTLNANAGHATASHAGGGAGGSIYVNCRVFQGSANGQVVARGGDVGVGGPSWNGVGGGGGRIAVIYQTCNLPSVRFSVTPGFSYFTTGGETLGSQMGTVYLSTTNAVTPLLSTISGRLIVPGFSTWSPPSLTVSNCAINFGNNFRLSVSGNLLVTGATTELRFGTNSELNCSGSLQMQGGKLLLDTNSAVVCNSGALDSGQLVVKGNLTSGTDFSLINSSAFYVYSGATNGAVDYGSLVVVTGGMMIASTCWVYPYSHPVNGGSPLFKLQTLTIETNAGFSAVGSGYGIGQGPGSRPQGDRGTGGSHAGKGGMGDQRDVPGPTYGTSNAPLTAGSGANISYGGSNKGFGGGVIRLEVTGTLILNGTLDASGGTHLGGSQHGGGGAGGSIFVITRSFESGINSLLYAKGGTAGVVDNTVYGGGGGGGGRIAMWVGPDREWVYKYVNLGQGSSPSAYMKFLGTTSVTNGLGYYNGPPDGAAPGTLNLLQLVAQGTVIVVQ